MAQYANFLIYIFAFVWFLVVVYEYEPDSNGLLIIWDSLLLTICFAIVILIFCLAVYGLHYLGIALFT